MKYSLWDIYCMVNCAGVYDSIQCKSISHNDIPHTKYQQAILRTVDMFFTYCDDKFEECLPDNDDGEYDTFCKMFCDFLLKEHREP